MDNKLRLEKAKNQILIFGSKQQGTLFTKSEVDHIDFAESALHGLQREGKIQNLGEITGSEVSETYKLTSEGKISLFNDLRN